MGDVKAAADYVAKLPAANGKVVVGGFCWGGAKTFNYAVTGADFKAGLVFYGNFAVERLALPPLPFIVTDLKTESFSGFPMLDAMPYEEKAFRITELERRLRQTQRYRLQASK